MNVLVHTLIWLSLLDPIAREENMQKVILITGSTDGIGLETARKLLSQNHHVLLHGRNPAKVQKVETTLSQLPGRVESYVADLSRMSDVKALAKAVTEKHDHLDVLINNAGVYLMPNPITKDGLDSRFVVNTIAPYLLTQELLPLLSKSSSSRVVNLSSAAQSPVNLDALKGKVRLSDGAAYAQSKLALTMWSRKLGLAMKKNPMIVSVNPGSLLDTKMVQAAYGTSRGSASVGADILVQASLSDEFSNASGQYFDNDSGRFASPHPDALNTKKCDAIVQTIEDVLANAS